MSADRPHSIEERVADLRGHDPAAAWRLAVDVLRRGGSVGQTVWLDHFVGRWADAHDGAACLLWDLARRYLTEDGEPPAWEDTEDVCTRFVMNCGDLYPNQAERDRVAQSTRATFAVVRAALALSAADAGRFHAALEDALRGYTGDETLSFYPLEAAEARPSSGADYAYAQACLRELARVYPDRGTELAVIQRGLFWVLGVDATSDHKDSLLLLVVTRDGDPVQGCVADLVVSRWQSGCDGQPTVFFTDPVYSGLLLFDDSWLRAFAAAHAAALHRRADRLPSCCYRVKFELGRLATLLNREASSLARPAILGQGSASATAACLLLAHADGQDVDRDYCLSAMAPAPATEEQLGSVGGKGFKLAGLAEVFRVFDSARSDTRPILLTPHRRGESETEDLDLVLQRFGMAWETVETLEQAYEMLIRRTAALRAYAAAERRALFVRLKQFFPGRYRRAICDGEFDRLDELSVPLDVMPSGGDDDAGRRNRAATLQGALDNWFASFANSGSRAPLLVVGEPGSGKTWMGLQLHMRLLREALTNPVTDPRPWLSLWLTCNELGTALRGSHDASSDLAAAVRAATRDRLGGEAEVIQEAFDHLLRRQLRDGRVLLIADAWDERSAADTARLQAALREWARHRPLLLTSRLAGHEAVAEIFRPLADHRVVRLARLADPAALITKWFGGRHELADRVAADSRLREVSRVPFHAALLCDLWESGPPLGPGELPTRPTDLIFRVVEQTLARPQAELDAPLTVDPMRFFATLAYQTFDGTRWAFSLTAFENEVRRLTNEFPSLRGDGAAARQLLVRGLFDIAPDSTFVVVHQSFAEALCARDVVERFGTSPTKFAEWLGGPAGARLRDPRFHDVWCHVAALLQDPTPLLEQLLANAGNDWGAALCLAGDCLAARARGWDSPSGSEVVRRLMSRWQAADYHPRAAAADTVVRLARSGYPEALLERLRTLFAGHDYGESAQQGRALLETIREVAPAEVDRCRPALTNVFRKSLEGNQVPPRARGIAQAALEALARYGPAADDDGFVELLLRVFAAEGDRYRAWLLEGIRAIRPAAAETLSAPPPDDHAPRRSHEGMRLDAIQQLALAGVGENDIRDLIDIFRQLAQEYEAETKGGLPVRSGALRDLRTACELLARYAERSAPALPVLLPLVTARNVNIGAAATEAAGAIALERWGDGLDRAAASPAALARELQAIREALRDFDFTPFVGHLRRGDHPVLANWCRATCERFGLYLDADGSLRLVRPRPLAEADHDVERVAKLW